MNAPSIAALLGLLLIVVAVIGLITGDIRALLAVIILIVGVINVLRAIPYRNPDS